MRDLKYKTTRRFVVAGLLSTALIATAQPVRAIEIAQAAVELDEGFDTAARVMGSPYSTTPTLNPSAVSSTEQAVEQYRDIVARGGWPNVPAGQTLKLGTRAAAVVALRQRLAVSGDLASDRTQGETFDSYVEAAVKRFQDRHGLVSDGVVRESTLQALNIPAAVRLKQLELNVVRLRTMGTSPAGRFVMVNIPAAEIEAVENGIVVSRHSAVVGKIDRQSPTLNSKVTQINFNPFWTVPASIVRKDLIPKMQADPEYLTKNKIRMYDSKGQERDPLSINWQTDEAKNYMFRQDPGEINSMGSVKINFPSPDGVYMHDTPSKNLFGTDARFHSSGCVRVQNVRELVAWTLRDTPGWEREKVDHALRSGDRIDATVKNPVALYWVYITAWATPDGRVEFRNDIYKRDGIPEIATLPQ